MRLARVISATALAAAAVLLASCGGSGAPTSSAATDPSFDVGPRTFVLMPATVGWTKQPADPIPTDARTVLVAGNIALASYPSFGTPVYSSGGNGWLDINTTPNFSLNPLGWRLTFRLKPSAQSLPIGSYSVTIPVMVPAATNNPTNIVVTFSNCGNCIFLGDVKPGVLTTTSPTWARSSTFNNSGTFNYQDWRLFVAPGQTVYVQMIGGTYVACAETGPLGDLSDPYEYVFSPDGSTFFTSNDDYCGYSSQVQVTNGGATTMEYLVRATQFSAGSAGGNGVGGYNNVGTYTIRVVSVPFGGGGGLLDFTSEMMARMKQKAETGSNH